MWMPQDLTDNKSKLVQVMALWRQAAVISWTNVDQILCPHMASLGPNELKAKHVCYNLSRSDERGQYL